MQFLKAGSNFYNELFGFLTAMEGPRRAPYDARDKVITIGVGYNLTNGSPNLRDGTLAPIKIIRANLTTHAKQMREEIEANKHRLTATQTADSYTYREGVH